MDRSLLPSKQFAIILVAITLLLAGGLAYYLVGDRSDDDMFALNDPQELARNAARTISEQDSDGDGLRDWEESLWGTDPYNPDTDGDGTLDGDEIEQGRDPLTPGPDDAITQDVITARTNAAAEEGELTLTAQFARNFFAEYAEISRSGLPVNVIAANAQNVEKLIPQNPLASGPNAYSADDILLESRTSRDALRVYGNALGAAVLAHEMTGNELAIFYKAISSGSRSEMQKLDAIIDANEKVVADIARVAVPEPLLNTHINLLNNSAKLLETKRAMRNVYIDPLKSMTSLEVYFTQNRAVANDISGIAEYLNINGVRYQPSEPGYILQEALINIRNLQNSL